MGITISAINKLFLIVKEIYRKVLSKYEKGEIEKSKLKNIKLNLLITMCTFNGANYLPEQLDSIVKQKGRN